MATSYENTSKIFLKEFRNDKKENKYRIHYASQNTLNANCINTDQLVNYIEIN